MYPLLLHAPCKHTPTNPSVSSASKTAGKVPELLYVWPPRAPTTGPFPADTGRRVTLVGRRLHLTKELRCQIGNEVRHPDSAACVFRGVWGEPALDVRVKCLSCVESHVCR